METRSAEKWFEEAEERRYYEDDFETAIDLYTNAINLCPNNAVYFTNRAFCHIKIGNWQKAVDDSRRAIELDNTSAEAHSILGEALLEKTEHVEAVRELKEAVNLERANGGTGEFYEWKYIRELLLKAKFYEWKYAHELRSWELQHLHKVCVLALTEMHSREASQKGGHTEAAEAQCLQQQLDSLERVFSEAAKADKQTEVPDYFRCPISYSVLRDPVITPSGHTYEREEILRHLGKVSDKKKRKKYHEKNHFDPITQEPLDPSQLVPNLAIKEAVEAFIEKHAWAYGELGMDISLTWPGFG
ncbi:hypothetical protein QN277_023241 [Acacia crassicarpa]|uniref:E3 ubiquitin-protein ligase CHIP n=1 Tax=Acacia crassicarpa TaxID=499986 RepID=A0AAE1JGJ3_9FABA|nr:hypothetical protein QN277_023241 [Acacia crassicarpa]